MKLKVEGIEEIEITDPLGLSNPPAPQAIPPQPRQPSLPQTILPSQPSVWPTPQVPTPFSPTPIPFAPVPNSGGPWIRPIDHTGDVAVPHKPPIYTRHVPDLNDPFLRAKWGIGGPMIQQAAEQTDPDKWEKNWQAKMPREEGQADGNQHTH